MIEVRFTRTNPDAVTPRIAHPGDVAADLFAITDAHIRPGCAATIGTGIAMAFPTGYYARVLSRSGLDFKSNVSAGAGVIDNGYRGEIKVVLRNHGSDSYQVRKGDRVAQLMIRRYEEFELIETDQLDDTERGTAGIGSTGR